MTLKPNWTDFCLRPKTQLYFSQWNWIKEKVRSFHLLITMKLYVYVLEARDLPENNCYVKLQVGKQKSKTRALKITTNAVWNEEFVFKVHDNDEELVLSVFRNDDDLGFFNGSSELMGRVRIQLCSLSAEDNHTLPPTWFSLEKPKTEKYISNVCG